METIKENSRICNVHEALILATHYYSSGDFMNAEGICDRILNDIPEHADSIHLLGCIAYQHGQIKKSIQLLSRSVEIAPNNPVYINNLGEILYGTGRIDEAINLFLRSLELKPDCAEAFHHLGNCYQGLGMMRKAEKCQRQALDIRPDFFRAHISLSSITLPGENYIAVLKRFHDLLRPSTYLEIGVETGKSLALAQPPTKAIGIDPSPNLRHKFMAPTRLYSVKSDKYFASPDSLKDLDGHVVELAFIDGLHLFNQVLRDFINIERYTVKNSIILIHDCIPLDKQTSAPTRDTKFWSGDPWKIIICLKSYRPDLKVFTIATPPTGLGVVTNLDPKSTLLDDNYLKVCDEFTPLDYSYLEDDRDELLNIIPNDWRAVLRHLERD